MELKMSSMYGICVGFFLYIFFVSHVLAKDYKALEKILQNVFQFKILPICGSVINSHQHLVLFHEFDNFHNNIFHKNYFTFENVYTPASRSKSEQSFRHSLPCFHFLVDETELERMDFNWIKQSLLNLHQSNVHFVFVLSNSRRLVQLHQTGAWDGIKYKTAIQVPRFETNFDLQKNHVNENTNLALEMSRPLPSERSLALGRHLRIGFWNFAPYTAQDASGRPVGGFTYSSVAAIAEAYNLSIDYDVTYKSLSQLPNGTWKGFMYDITDGESDACFGLGPIVSRIAYVDFTTSSLYFYLKFFTSHPEVTIKWQAIVFPFDRTVWLLLGLIFLGSIPLFYVQIKITAGTSYEGRLAPFLSFFIPYGIFVGQVWMIPRSAKFLTLLFIFFALIITTCYNSNLISFLTFPESDPVPETFEQLASALDRYRVVLWNARGHLASVYLENTQRRDMVKIREAMELYDDQHECPFKAAAEAKTACIAFTLNIEMWTVKNLTLYATWNPLLHSKDTPLSVPVTMALKKRSRYFDLFNKNIGILRDNGLMHYWKMESLEYVRVNSIPWMRDQIARKSALARNLTRSWESAQVGELKPFSFNNFILCFASLFVGIFLSILGFLFEKLIRRDRTAEMFQALPEVAERAGHRWRVGARAARKARMYKNMRSVAMTTMAINNMKRSDFS